MKREKRGRFDKMATVIVEPLISTEEAQELTGDYIPTRILDRTQIIDYDADVYTMDGRLLAKFRRAVISPTLCELAETNFLKAATLSYNRGAAAGPIDMAKLPPEAVELRPRRAHEQGTPGKNYTYYIRRDGTDAKNCVSNGIFSGLVGFYEKARQLPCRLTTFTRKHLQKYEKGLPFFQRLSELYGELVPDRYLCQKARAEENPGYVIPGTVFSTVSVNKNFRTAVHKDKGDYEKGFGVLACIERGYQGCHTILPEWGVGFDLRTGDVLCMNVHEFHGNGPLHATDENYLRLVFTCYLRQRIVHCEKKGTSAESPP
jgi:hypothetical protein